MRGDLSKTSAADVCRALAASGADGVLDIEGPDGRGSVVWRGGAVIAATSPTPRARLGDRLVGAGLLSEDALSDVLHRQARDGDRRRLGAILVDEQLVSRDAIRLVAQEQVLDAVFDVLSWRYGAYRLDPLREDEIPEVPLRLPVEHLLVEVARRQEEWAEVERVIPDLASVPSFREQGSADAALEPDEFAVLASIDGVRSVRELASDLGYGEFEAARIIYGLHLLGIVEVTLPEDEIGRALEEALSGFDEYHDARRDEQGEERYEHDEAAEERGGSFDAPHEAAEHDASEHAATEAAEAAEAAEPTPSTPRTPTPAPTEDEPTPWEPAPDEPTPWEPAPDEPAPWEPAPDEPAPWEPAPDEPTPWEPPASEPAATDDPTPWQPPTSEPAATDDPTPWEPPTGEPAATDDPTPWEPPTGEPVATDPPPSQPAADAVAAQPQRRVEPDEEDIDLEALLARMDADRPPPLHPIVDEDAPGSDLVDPLPGSAPTGTGEGPASHDAPWTDAWDAPDPAALTGDDEGDAGGDRHPDDVAELLRELSRLAIDEPADPDEVRGRSGPRAGGGGRTADRDDKRKRRGLFGR